MFKRLTEPRRRVVFHLKSGESIEAVLYPQRACPKGHYLVSAAKLRVAEDQATPLSFGDVEIPRENVRFYEVAV